MRVLGGWNIFALRFCLTQREMLGKEMYLHLCPCKVFKGSKGQTERTDFPQSEQKCLGRNGESKRLHAGLAGLLRNYEHENNHERLGRMASSEISDARLETMEETKNKIEKSDAFRASRVASL